jgi:hypothetical protein
MGSLFACSIKKKVNAALDNNYKKTGNREIFDKNFERIYDLYGTNLENGLKEVDAMKVYRALESELEKEYTNLKDKNEIMEVLEHQRKIFINDKDRIFKNGFSQVFGTVDLFDRRIVSYDKV